MFVEMLEVIPLKHLEETQTVSLFEDALRNIIKKKCA